MQTVDAALPIGLFDSGVGGLTVLRAIMERLPGEDMIYLGDTARLPYGTKSPETVARYALQASAKLVERKIKLLVIACNTATAAALPALEKAFAPLPVVGVIRPGAAAAVDISRNGHIVVIATEGTIKGGAYQQAIRSLRPEAVITGQPCTLFVPLAEEGWTSGPLVEGIASRYLSHIFQNNGNGSRPDCLLLGCTHFPPLKEALANVAGEGVALVDSAATTALAVEKTLENSNLLRTDGQGGKVVFLTTDDVSRFTRTGSIFLGREIGADAVELVDL